MDHKISVALLNARHALVELLLAVDQLPEKDIFSLVAILNAKESIKELSQLNLEA